MMRPMATGSSMASRMFKTASSALWQRSQNSIAPPQSVMGRSIENLSRSFSTTLFVHNNRHGLQQTTNKIVNPLCLSTIANKNESNELPFRTNLNQFFSLRFRSNRSRRGLYDGKDVRFGNKRSFAMNKSRRKFKPNVFLKRVYSETLDEMIRFHLTTKALRSIDKAGGLDNYLLKSKHVTSGEGLEVKTRILKIRRKEEKKAARRAAFEAEKAKSATEETVEQAKVIEEKV
mmetsp:Transcript_24331/g.37493  ORF Transcript_24331/g.37493 Transcript_24331/m.37493 type:complete len:232 (+) Transcript_24331:34-729(+)